MTSIENIFKGISISHEIKIDTSDFDTSTLPFSFYRSGGTAGMRMIRGNYNITNINLFFCTSPCLDY